MWVALLFLLIAGAQAQVQFEVASVKAGDAIHPEYSYRPTAGGLEIRDTTLRNLVRGAYSLNEYQLAGGPKWLDTARFNIDAKFPVDAPRNQMPLMMQALLAERFQLTVHRESRTLPEYALVIAKDGPKLQAASEDDRAHRLGSLGQRQIKARGMPVSELAGMLGVAARAPVVDQTGLKGEYNFTLEFAPMEVGTGPRDNETSLFAAVQRLGLRLKSIKGPMEILVIDHAEMPAEN
jgi:uncharacterized protein (TIGR03435 family)